MLLGIDSRGDRDFIRENLNIRSRALGHRVAWLEPLGFTNNYVIVVEKDKIKNVESINDLEHKAEQLTFGGNMEFMNRFDGYPGLCKAYRLTFRKEVICSYGDRYGLLKEKKVDVIEGFQTDPELRDKDLKVLNDPKQFFPEYHALPVFREDALKKIEGLHEIVDKLKDRLRKALRQELAVTPEMELVKFGTLERTEFKAKRIDDLRSSS